MVKSSRRSFKKRRYTTKSSRSYVNAIVSIPGGDYCMPPRLKTAFTYVGSYALASTTGSISRQVMRGNSPYDPDQSGTGNQPNGFDQLVGGIYLHYAVIGCKISVICTPATVPWKVVIVPTQVSTGTNMNYENAIQMAGAKGMITSAANAGGNVKTLISYARTYSILGLDPTKENSSSAASNSNPANQWYWQIIGAPIDGVSTDVCFIEVKITYYCLLSELTMLPQS